MSNQLTLESLSEEYNGWRSSSTKQGRIPDELWDKTLSLLDTHSMTEIGRKLAISHEQIKSRLKKVNKTYETKPQFAEIQMPSIKHERLDIQLGSRIEIKRSDGSSMLIEHINDNTLTMILAAFMRES